MGIIATYALEPLAKVTTNGKGIEISEQVGLIKSYIEVVFSQASGGKLPFPTCSIFARTSLACREWSSNQVLILLNCFKVFAIGR